MAKGKKMPGNLGQLNQQIIDSGAKSVTDIINEKAKEAKFKHDIESEQQAVFDSFKEWMEKPIPKYVDQHILKDGEMIIRIFGFRPNNTNKSKLFLDAEGTRTAADLSHRTFPIAKVLTTGENCPYSVGQIVKLRDFEVSSIENPEYSLWINNEYSKSNLKQIGQEPPRFLNNIGKTFGPKMIALNPLKVKLEEDDFLTFKVFPSDISNAIKDVYAFLD